MWGENQGLNVTPHKLTGPMTFSLADVDRSRASLREFEDADLASVNRTDLLRLQRLAAEGRRAWDVALAEVAGEIARRSSADEGPAGLARQQGFASPEQLVASMIGAPVSDGRRLVTAGRTLRVSASMPARECHPAIAEALRDGGITVAMAELITQTVEALSGETSDLENQLTRIARTQSFARLRLACRTLAAHHDAAQLEDRERRQHAARYLDVTEDVNGMTHLRGAVGPDGAAFLCTFLDAQVKAAFQAKRDDPTDTRTASQIRADAFVALAMHGLDCDSPATGVKATVIVRMDAEHLAKKVGAGTCDALGTPISLSTLRQLAVDAAILPIVMGGKSEMLDAGRAHRLYSWHQRMALAERDRGCAKCHAPISHCVTHHIRWWSQGGTTDLRNGVLLCVRCHTQIHHDRWGIEVDEDNHVWFTPPPQVDPDQHRILGGPAALMAA